MSSLQIEDENKRNRVYSMSYQDHWWFQFRWSSGYSAGDNGFYKSIHLHRGKYKESGENHELLLSQGEKLSEESQGISGSGLPGRSWSGQPGNLGSAGSVKSGRDRSGGSNQTIK